MWGDVYNQFGRGHGPFRTAAADRTHGEVCVENGVAGIVVKQSLPDPDVARADQQTVPAGESYVQLQDGLCRIPVNDTTGDLSAARNGDLVWADPASPARARFALVDGGSWVPLGRVWAEAGENGAPADQLTVDMNQKV